MSYQVVGLRRTCRELFYAWAVLLVLGAASIVWLGDAPTLVLITGWPWTQSSENLLRFITGYGMYPFYVFFLGLLWLGWSRKDGTVTAIAQGYLIAQMLGSVLIVRSLKMLLGHGRPDADALAGQWVGPTWDAALHSFPSGHTADLFTSTIFLALLLPYRSLRALCLAFAMLMGFTRLALSKHFPVDVLGGAFIGGATALAVINFWVLPRLGNEPPPQHAKGHC